MGPGPVTTTTSPAWTPVMWITPWTAHAQRFGERARQKIHVIRQAVKELLPGDDKVCEGPVHAVSESQSLVAKIVIPAAGNTGRSHRFSLPSHR